MSDKIAKVETHYLNYDVKKLSQLVKVYSTILLRLLLICRIYNIISYHKGDSLSRKNHFTFIYLESSSIHVRSKFVVPFIINHIAHLFFEYQLSMLFIFLHTQKVFLNSVHLEDGSRQKVYI